MAVNNQEGPFKRKHLCKCSPTARPYWPYLSGCRTTMPRLELDSECIADRHLWAGAHFCHIVAGVYNRVLAKLSRPCFEIGALAARQLGTPHSDK